MSKVSDLKIIKQKIINENRIEDLLESIGCHHFRYEQRGFLITAGLPDSTNPRSVQIKMNEYLGCTIRNRSDFEGRDIFALVSYIHFQIRGEEELIKNTHKAKEYICQRFGWSEFLSKRDGDIIVKDYTACLRNILGDEEKRKEIKPNPLLDESILNQFYYRGNPIAFDGWIKEGISYETQVMYGIGFDLESHRITIPMRNKDGSLVGVKGRIMKDEDDDRKYLYLYRYNNSQELFNYHYAKPYVEMEKRVYVLEAEKSPMQLFSNGVFNAVAIGASDITDIQADLIRVFGSDVEIILCYDKGISKKDIMKNAKHFKDRKVYGMLDLDNLLDDKMSPIDKGIDVWNQLVENNIYPIKN